MAVAQAEDLVRKYYAVTDELGLDPTADLMRLEDVAISQELDVQRRSFQDWRNAGWIQKGRTKVLEVAAQSVNLDNSDPATGRVPTVMVDACYDVTAVDVVDPAGTSVVLADRPDRAWVRFTVSNHSWDTDPENAWRVSIALDQREQEPCEPAS
ncbi:hypothetical protein [Xylanimonas ulmi]|uniref:Uncharacterized protein n=1 Tax=Xylanimonas ulmi TaxID=228973 RepID=A0A4Q7M041_9MICO|nr:hypothetical protein [Xylanibacterium ulmi]RZS60684.1 hypothetical protein EV386_0956 [Xylanibacterium ulmi]